MISGVGEHYRGAIDNMIELQIVGALLNKHVSNYKRVKFNMQVSMPILYTSLHSKFCRCSLSFRTTIYSNWDRKGKDEVPIIIPVHTTYSRFVSL